MQNTWVTWPRIFLGFLKIAILTDFLLFLGSTFKDFWNCKRVTRYFFLETCISEHGDTCVSGWSRSGVHMTLHLEKKIKFSENF